jgi:Asp-tRNA(Asn)/Glu-tRNA(Gln) amidotransferase A subunit family amidase
MMIASRRSIASLSKDIANGLSPVQIVESCLARIADRNAALNAMIFVDAEGALDAARHAEAELKAGRSRGPLHGIPVALKDVIDVEGWPTTAGSRLFDGRVAEADAPCVANLKAAGAVILGKTNLYELTVGGPANPWFGKVVNPLDASRGTGGTSSGSAAAVAAGFCVAALGSDTGGSNRSPAAATGLVGFKPSNGLVDLTGVRPTAASLDTVGPIAATVDDAKLVTEAMLGRTLVTSRRPSACGPALPDIVIARCPDLYAADVDPLVEQSIEAWLRELRRGGAKTVELTFDDNEAFVDAGLVILSYEFAREYGPLVERHPDRVGDTVHGFLDQARQVDRQSFADAVAVRERTRIAFAQKMQGFDALVVPTAPGLAPRLSDELTRVGDTMVSYSLAGGRFRRWANMLAMPALAVPIGTAEDLPVSIQLAAQPGNDSRLFDVAKALTVAMESECAPSAR